MELRGKVPAGEYTGIKFRIGVPQSINHDELTAHASPLNKSALYWDWAMGHIFFSAVSRTMIDIAEDDGGVDDDSGVDDADGGTEPSDFNTHFTHVGATGCDGDPTGGEPVTTCTNPNRAEITLSDFDHVSQTIIADFAQVKRGSDVAANIGCHSFTANTCTSPFLRLGLSYATGEASGLTQTVFRAE
jgi:uncharacterized repeat protein (TIGR04052 family)